MQHFVTAAGRKTLCRSFPVAVLLHVLVGVTILVGIKYGPVAPVIPAVPGLVLDVAEPAPTQQAVAEPLDLAQALSEIPPESRGEAVALVSEIPDVRPSLIPEPSVKAPASGAIRSPLIPEVGGGLMRGAWPAELSVTTEGASGRGASTPMAVAGPSRGGQPIALAEILPQYPYGARARGEAGRVVVHVRVGADGRVERADVVAGSGYTALDHSAVVAARKAHFKPAEQDGVPVSADMNLQFEFRLEDR